VKDWLKRILPRWFQYLLYRGIWDPIRKTVWKALDLQCTLRSGIRVRVLSHPDWVIYNEVIVNGEYDSVIRESLAKQRPDSPMRVVDLGANVGYFTFRFADLYLQKFGPGGGLQLTVVEGSPIVFAQLQKRICEEPFLRDHTELANALAGRRAGGAYIPQGYVHYGHGASPDRTYGARFVPYVDLATIVKPGEKIDLLKCDIEGAEFDLIDNYAELLRNVDAAVIEFHHYGRDVDRARAQLYDLGFKPAEVLSAVSPCSVELFRR
jgi:FkbM family methyltransferase